MRILVVGMGHFAAPGVSPEARVRSGGETKLVEALRRWQHEPDVEIDILGAALTRRYYTADGITRVGYLTLDPALDEAPMPQAVLLCRRAAAARSYPLPRTYDVVFAGCDFLYDVVPAAALARRARAALVSPVYLVAPDPGSALAAGRGLRAWGFKAVQEASLAILRRRAARVWVLNTCDRRTLLGRGFRPHQVEVVSGGVNLGDVDAAPTRADLGSDVVFLGRFHRQKGLWDALDVWSLVVERIPAARFTIIGGGDDATVARLGAEVRARGLERSVTVRLNLTRPEIFGALRASRVFLFPSHHESWGMVAAEAMAARLPVAAYDLEVFRDIFTGGWVRVAPGDVRALVGAVVGLLEDDAERRALADEARRVVETYSWEDVSARDLERLRTIVREGR